MNDFKEMQLGQEAIDYIQYLLNSGKTLSRCILKNCNLDYGKVKIYLPTNFSDERVNEFGCDLKLPVGSIINMPSGDYAYPTSITDSLLAEIIQSYLENDKDNICVLEDVTANADAPCMMHVVEDSDTIIFGQEIYYILNNNAAMDKKKIMKTISYAKSLWHFICVFTSISQRGKVFYNKPINEYELNVLSKSIKKMAIGAYDGKGYLIWQRD